MATDHLTRDVVRETMRLHLGIRAGEIAEILKIGRSAAERYVRDIRAEWQGKE